MTDTKYPELTEDILMGGEEGEALSEHMWQCLDEGMSPERHSAIKWRAIAGLKDWERAFCRHAALGRLLRWNGEDCALCNVYQEEWDGRGSPCEPCPLYKKLGAECDAEGQLYWQVGNATSQEEFTAAASHFADILEALADEVESK